MAKKKKQHKETTIEDFYDLRQKEMDELVAALKGDSETAEKGEAPPVPSLDIQECTGEETKGKKKFNPYSVDKFSRIPTPIKALFIKWWFAGLVCYLILMGLGTIGTTMDTLDLLVISGVVLGILVDCMVNPILRMVQSDRKEMHAYMMFPFPFKAYWTFLTNAIYYVGVMVVVNYCYFGLNLLIQLGNSSGYVALESLLFGVFAVIADMAFIGIKDLIVYLVKRGKEKRKLKKENEVKEEEIADV